MIVGVKVGSLGVNVSVDSDKAGKGVAGNADWVNPEITVCAAAVLMESASCNVTAGIAQATITIDKVIIVKETRLESNMVHPSIAQVRPDDQLYI